MAAKWLAELVGSDSLRVMVLVPYASPGNRLDLLHEQLQDHCEYQLGDRLAITVKPLQFPESRDDLCRNLEYELNTQLEVGPGEPPQHLLRRHVPRTPGETRPVLWLNWGLFGDRNPSLKPSELTAWLNFAAGYLTQNCPADLRIVCYAAVEVDQDKHKKLKRNLQDHNRHFVEPSFWLRILEPLENVEENELLDFLKLSAHPHLGNPNEIGELAQRMIEATGGRFEELLLLVRDAESGSSWYDILHRLRDQQGAIANDDDSAY